MKMTSENASSNIITSTDCLMRMLDRGIDEMEAGKELPLDEAFQKISELRNRKRNARA